MGSAGPESTAQAPGGTGARGALGIVHDRLTRTPETGTTQHCGKR